MGNDVKVLIGEINGQELDQQEEYVMQLDDMPTVDTSTNPPNVGDRLEWDGTNWVPIAPAGGLEFGYSKQMGNNAEVQAGKWLEYHHNIFSNDSPFYPPKNVKLKAISAAFENPETVTFGVYKNGTQIDTLIITASDNGAKINLNHSLLTTDGVSVKVESGSAHKPVFSLFFG